MAAILFICLVNNKNNVLCYYKILNLGQSGFNCLKGDQIKIYNKIFKSKPFRPILWVKSESLDNWPTWWFTDSVSSQTANSSTRPLTDMTSHRQNFQKTHRLTRQHSPTVTIPGKWMKENRSINHKVYLSKQTKNRSSRITLASHRRTKWMVDTFLLNEWLLQAYSPPCTYQHTSSLSNSEILPG